MDILSFSRCSQRDERYLCERRLATNLQRLNAKCVAAQSNERWPLLNPQELLVSTYVVYERQSVIQGLPESGTANENLGRSWHFEFEFVWRVPLILPPPSENENLGRSWHFDFEFVWRVTLPPPRKWKFAQILALWVWVGLERPPPFLQYVKTNRCMPEGYHLVSYFVNPVWIRIDLHALLQQLFKNLTFSQKDLISTNKYQN